MTRGDLIKKRHIPSNNGKMHHRTASTWYVLCSQEHVLVILIMHYSGTLNIYCYSNDHRKKNLSRNYLHNYANDHKIVQYAKLYYHNIKIPTILTLGESNQNNIKNVI